MCCSLSRYRSRRAGWHVQVHGLAARAQLHFTAGGGGPRAASDPETLEELAADCARLRTEIDQVQCASVLSRQSWTSLISHPPIKIKIFGPTNQKVLILFYWRKISFQAMEHIYWGSKFIMIVLITVYNVMCS